MPLPSYHPTEMEKAYLAGILDGEGYIAIARKATCGKSYYRAYVEVTNTRRLLLEWIQARWGGCIYPDSHAAFNRPNNAVCWKWALHSGQAKRVLREVLEYLVIKPEQATIVLDFPCRPRSGKGFHRRTPKSIALSGKLFNRLRWLHQHGGKVNALRYRQQVLEATTGEPEAGDGGDQEVGNEQDDRTVDSPPAQG